VTSCLLFCFKVQPFAGIIDTVRHNVPRVLFNREAVGPFRYSRRAQDVVAAGWFHLKILALGLKPKIKDLILLCFFHSCNNSRHTILRKHDYNCLELLLKASFSSPISEGLKMLCVYHLTWNDYIFLTILKLSIPFTFIWVTAKYCYP